MSLEGETCVMRPNVPLEFVGWDFQDFSVCCKNEWFARLLGYSVIQFPEEKNRKMIEVSVK